MMRITNAKTALAMTPILIFALTSCVLADVVINEIELNPTDNTSMWVELYNTGTNNVSLDNWKVIISDGAWNGEIAIREGSIIEPEGFFVAVGRESWDNLKTGRAQLINDSGIEVDRTPILEDDSDNGFTNGRVKDGADSDSDSDWAFMMGSRNAPNGGFVV